MTMSDLTDYYLPVPGKCTVPRQDEVRKVTVHHMAGNLDVWGCQDVFNVPGREASSNYGIDSEGRIACYIDEDDRAWTSASWWNDNQAITLEVADYDTSKWSPSDEAYDATVALCADICNRYGIEPYYDGTPNGTFTEHRMYASTSCPGPWWHARMSQFVQDVIDEMEGGDVITDSDIEKIAIKVWEYIYHQGKADEDKTLQNAGYTVWSNRYNVLNAAFNEAHKANERVDALEKKLASISVGDVTVDIDYTKMAKAVNDDAAKRMKE